MANKTCKVVRLKTEFRSDKVQNLILEQTYDTGVGPVTEILTVPIQVNTPSEIEWFHLYVLSDDVIKPGDLMIIGGVSIYRYDPYNEFRSSPDLHTLAIKSKYDKKIIASTDNTLGEPKYTKSYNDDDEYECTICGTKHIERNARATWFTPCKCKGVPMVSEAFVQAYADNNGIDEVLVDYMNEPVFKPKVRDDNTIIINQAKTYTHAQVETLLFELADHWGYTSSKEDMDDFNQWCNENLKQ